MAEELRSLRSNEKCYIRFVNKTRRCIDLLWIDFTGQFVKYKILDRGQYVDINTYKTHPWVAVDSKNDSMLLSRQFTYFPRTPVDMLRARPINQVPLRTVVHITIPLYSLLYRCLLEVRNHLKSEEDIESLEITKRLKDDLRKMLRERDERNLVNIISPPNT